MKKVTLTLVVLFVVALGGLQAQNYKRVESNLQLGLGNFYRNDRLSFRIQATLCKRAPVFLIHDNVAPAVIWAGYPDG